MRISVHVNGTTVLTAADDLSDQSLCLLPAFSRPRYEGWPHHEQSFSIDVCLPHTSVNDNPVHYFMLSIHVILGLPRLLECGSLGLYLVLFPSAGSPLSFSIYVHSMPVSFLSRTQVDLLTSQRLEYPFISPLNWSSLQYKIICQQQGAEVI